MITLLSEIHFWTTHEDVIVKHTDYGSFKYYSKRDEVDSLGSEAKKQYCEQRGLLWHIPNKRPSKLKEKLKELEEHLINNRIVSFTWVDNKLRLLLSTGLLTTITLNSRTGDFSSILLDKQLSTKLQANIICDGTIFGNQVICICNDGHLLGFGGQWKDGWVLEGSPRRKLHYHGEWLAVWGKAGAEHPQPWSPLAKDYQRANLHLYWIGSRDPELLAYKKTDGEPLQVIVSKMSNRTLIVIEQKVTQKGSVSVEVSNFELAGNNLKRVSVTSVPLQTQVSCLVLSDLEDRLLICCIDGSLALLDRYRGSTRTVKAAFIPTFAVWHPAGGVVAISNERGQLQYYDTALACIKSQFFGEDCTPTAILDLSGYFSMHFSIASISWGTKELVLSLEQGPMVIITHVDNSLTFRSLVKKYLIMGKVDKAIKLLLSWDFNDDSFFALQKIVAYLLRQPLTDELAQHLQNALGCFHNSATPIRSQMQHKYGSQVFSLTRRFFHQLVRGNMFETAFLLAVDIGHHDLFMDLHYIAVKIGETEMAAAARAQASALLSRCSSEASNCSRSSCSQCSDSESSSSSDDYNSLNNQRGPQTVVPNSNSYIPPLPLNTDNCLTTDFNQPDPTTYKPVLGKDNTVISHSFDYHRMSYTPKATFVKSPQVPSHFNKVSKVPPPLPFAPPLPIVCNSSLGIPYLHTSLANNSFQNFGGGEYNHVNNMKLPISNDIVNSNMTSTSFALKSKDSKPLQNSMYAAFSSSNLTLNNIKKSFTSISKVQPPPLPSLSTSTVTNFTDSVIFSSNLNEMNNLTSLSSNTAQIAESSASTASGGKKHQAKVKFSDTVTAFIVPEIKRPQRLPPPSHVTNPQKELADSLPLCHPNEDYLKDFAPVRKEDSNDESDSSQQPKIKVVHFGVV